MNLKPSGVYSSMLSNEVFIEQLETIAN